MFRRSAHENHRGFDVAGDGLPSMVLRVQCSEQRRQLREILQPSGLRDHSHV